MFELENPAVTPESYPSSSIAPGEPPPEGWTSRPFYSEKSVIIIVFDA